MWWALKQNIIELYLKLENQGNRDINRERFINAAQNAWRALDQELIKKLINLMSHRIEAVIKARGWQTKY